MIITPATASLARKKALAGARGAPSSLTYELAGLRAELMTGARRNEL
jgi:hypothetical protein